MNSKLLSLLAVLPALTFSNISIAQENDDMYFSRKDRAKYYASAANPKELDRYANNSDYASNHNFNSPTVQSTSAGSPTVQPVGKPEDANNQYFIKDYSIKNKTDNEVKTYSGINSNNGFRSGVNVILSFGSFYGTPSYGYGFGYYNPYTDPFSPYYDPFYQYRSPNYYASYRYNPWRYNRNYGYGYNSNYYNSNTCYYPTNGYTSYASNSRDEVRYRNGRKVISGSRSGRSAIRNTENPNRGRAVVNDSKPTNGRTSGNRSRTTYRKYTGNNKANTGTNSNRSNTYNRRNSNSGNSNSYRSSGSNNRSNSYRSSGSSGSNNRSSSSSGSRSSYSSGSRSSGSSSRPASGGSRSSSGRRGN